MVNVRSIYDTSYTDRVFRSILIKLKEDDCSITQFIGSVCDDEKLKDLYDVIDEVNFNYDKQRKST